jgi:TPR repeat protein
MEETEESFNLEALTAKAESGDVEAQYEMGWRHALGMEVDLDDDIAVEWLEKAADGGHMLAQNNMGARYYTGDGVDQDHKVAYRFFFQAADQGDRKASKNLDAVARQLSEDDLKSLRAEMGEANFASEE